MARYDFRTPRLFVNDALAASAEIALEKPQGHYLTNVLRLKAGDPPKLETRSVGVDLQALRIERRRQFQDQGD